MRLYCNAVSENTILALPRQKEWDLFIIIQINYCIAQLMPIIQNCEQIEQFRKR